MVIALDVHTHIPGPPDPDASAAEAQQREAFQRYFRSENRPKDVDEFYQTYVDMDMKAITFGVDAETQNDRKYFGNEYVYEVTKRYSDRLMGFGSVDPHKGRWAVREAQRCAEEFGFKGLKFHPTHQQFFANEEQYYPLWEMCQRLGLVCLFHSGHAAAGSGTPGGGGRKLKYNRPIPNIDDIAADFPELNIILAHPSWPWQSEQLSMLVHKTNVYMDLSGWSPKYYTDELVHYMNTRVRDKVLLATDYPAIHPQRWLDDFNSIAVRDEVKPLIMKENAKRLFKIEDGWLD